MKLKGCYFWCISILLSPVLLLIVGCGSSGCGGLHGDYWDRNMMVVIETKPFIFDSDSFKTQLINPISPSYNDLKYKGIIGGIAKNEFPLMIAYNRMDFLVTKSTGETDSLTIEYEIEPYYNIGSDCRNEGFYPKVKVNQCYSRNKLFIVQKFSYIK